MPVIDLASEDGDGEDSDHVSGIVRARRPAKLPQQPSNKWEIDWSIYGQ